MYCEGDSQWDTFFMNWNIVIEFIIHEELLQFSKIFCANEGVGDKTHVHEDKKGNNIYFRTDFL